ncbi:MAG: hypothetical protein DELT_00312 [Desulfovibrio sp.]
MAELEPAAAKLLQRICEADASPVCVFDIPREGGATYYSLRRIREYLAHGRGVVRLTCRKNGTLAGTAHYRDLSASISLPSLLDLLEPGDFPMPRFQTLLVNELVSWTLPLPAQEGRIPNGSGGPRWIPAILEILGDLAIRWRVRYEFVAHDYFPVCPNFILLNDAEQSRYCGVPSYEACEACLAQSFMREAFGSDFSLSSWRSVWDAFLGNARRVTFPSEAARRIFLRAFSGEGKRLTVIPHEPLVPALSSLTQNASPMHIVVVGQITVPKGAKIVRDLALLLRERDIAARMTLVGSLAAPGVTLPDSVTVTGPYEKEKLGEILQDIGATVGLMPSVWPETFNYVCQELMQLGLPLVCFDLGAPADRVRNWERGAVARDVSAEAALDALLGLTASITVD